MNYEKMADGNENENEEKEKATEVIEEEKSGVKERFNLCKKFPGSNFHCTYECENCERTGKFKLV